MSEITEVKNRIKGVSDTRKITGALYLISSAKVKKAREELEKTAPYFYGIRKEIKSIFKTVEHIDSKYLYPENDHMKNAAYGYLVITADKGMAGAYNHNVLKRAEAEIKKHENSKLFILYTDMADGGIIIKSTRILPFHTAEFIAEKDKSKEEFEFVPSREAVLDNLAPSYVCGYVYSSLVDSYCAEQNARLVAMKSASDNADGILSDLTRDYNRIRQDEITTEIAEISSGAKFQRGKLR